MPTGVRFFTRSCIACLRSAEEAPCRFSKSRQAMHQQYFGAPLASNSASKSFQVEAVTGLKDNMAGIPTKLVRANVRPAGPPINHNNAGRNAMHRIGTHRRRAAQNASRPGKIRPENDRAVGGVELAVSRPTAPLHGRRCNQSRGLQM